MFDRNMQFGKLEYLSKKIQGDSLYYDKIYDGGDLGLVLIDGWHSFKGAYLDFLNVNKTLIPGGMVCFHDVDLFETQVQIEEYYKLAKDNYDYLMSEELPNDNLDEQSFHLEELVAFIIKEHGFSIITPSVFNGIRRPSNVWKPGTPDTNSLVLLKKPT
jgi:hypothetical protein